MSGAVVRGVGTPYNPSVIVTRYQPGAAPTDPVLALVNQRLEAAHTILAQEAQRLTSVPRSKLSATDAAKLFVLENESCAAAAVNLDRAAAGGVADPVDLSSNLPQMTSREIMNQTGGSNPVRLQGGPNALEQQLPTLLQQDGSRAVVVINRADGAVGHVFNAENIQGQIWLMEAHDAVAVSLGGQPAGVAAVEGFYPQGQISSFDVVVTHS